ncbi:cellulose synthesis regulatory protein [Arthrobacter sp. Hiyo8]|nr:cellulose synthesis regulatory protein [Arthrobacter sp. Hiyo8]
MVRGLVYLGFMTVGIALASRDLWLLDSSYSHVHKSMALAAGFLAAYYFCRLSVYLVEGPSGPNFRLYFGPSMASLVTLILLVAVSFSMTALSNDQLINRLSERAARDNLTGLLNRGTFMELAIKELERLHTTNSVASLILADLDHFKAINDEYGHAAGTPHCRRSRLRAPSRYDPRTWSDATGAKSSSCFCREPARKGLKASRPTSIALWRQPRASTTSTSQR